MLAQKLPRSFFARDTHEVAHSLLGKVLVRTDGRQVVSGRIVEVESYVGEHDAACHAAPRKRTSSSRGRRGRTPRTEVMFGEAGHAYVYFIYGMYHCFNIVTEREGFAAAVLVRALEPLAGQEIMRERRKTADLRRLTSGPGRLCQALGIDRTFSGEDLVTSTALWVGDDGTHVTNQEIVTTTRVGVDYAGADALLPWRYYVKGSPYVSRR